MILIKKGQTNNISVSVSLNKTITNPYYLFSFTHILSKNQVNFIPKVISTGARYDEFRFVEGPSTDLSLDPPQVNFLYDGQYWVQIYQQTSSGNTNPNLAYSEIWDGRAEIENLNIPDPYYQWVSDNEDNSNFIFISDDEGPQTPTPTPTSTLTPTPSVTPTLTPTQSPIPVYPFLVDYDGSLDNLCQGSGTISVTLYGLNPVFENNTNLYLDAGQTIDAPMGYVSYLGTIVEINPSGVVSGVVVCPSPTPTGTPTMTPTPTQSLTPTPTETPTPTPTPSSTPPNNFLIGVGFQGFPLKIIVDSNDDLYISGGMLAYNEYEFGTKGMTKLLDSGAIDLTFQAGNRTGIGPGGQFVMKEDETGNYIYMTQQTARRLVKIDKTTGDEVWNLSANNNIVGLGVDPTTGNLLLAGATSYGGQSRPGRLCLVDKDGNVLPDVFGTGVNSVNIPFNIFMNRNGNWVLTGPFTTYNGLPANRILEITTAGVDTGFWGTGLSSVPNSIYQHSTTGDYYVVWNGGTINGQTTQKIARLDETGVNIPYPITLSIGGIVPRGQYFDETNNLIYIYNNTSPSQLSRYDITSGVRDLTWETTLGSVTWSSVTPNTANTWLVGVNSNNKIYLVGGLTQVQGVITYGIARTQQDGTINTANF